MEKFKSLVEPEICPRCGTSFTCSKSGKCWCFSVYVPENVRDELDKKYATCLCPACLHEVVAMAEKGLNKF